MPSRFDNEPNIDQREIDKFAAISAEWWDPHGKFKPLHRINPLRIDYILSKVESLENKKILDVGCGGGILSEALAKFGAEVTGIDMSQAALDCANAHAQAQQLSITYLLESIEQHFETTNNQYDIITCMELLEHVPNPASIIHACAGLLAPNGKLFLSTINRNHKSRLMLIIGAEYIARILPIGTHHYNKFIRPSELMQWMQQSGLHTKEFMGMEYNLLKNQFKLGKNIDVNYLAYAMLNDTCA